MSEREKQSFLHEVFKDGVIVGIVGIIAGVVSHSTVLFQVGLGIAAGSAVGEALT